MLGPPFRAKLPVSASDAVLAPNAKIVTDCSNLEVCIAVVVLVHCRGRSQQRKDGRAPAKLRRGSGEKGLRSVS